MNDTPSKGGWPAGYTRLMRAEDWPASGDVVIFDLEYTAWEGSLAREWTGPNEYMEVVQIGAVRIDAQGTMPEQAAFDRLCHPVFNPVLSGYFTDLTGITQDALDGEGVGYAQAVREFHAFCEGAAMIAANGWDSEVLEINCQWRSIPFALDRALCVNTKQFFSDALRLPRTDVSSSALPEHFGLPAPVGAHTGLGDARAIADAFREVRRRGEV